MCNTILLESVKLRAWGACVLACFSCLRDCVLTWWRVYVIACLRAYVLGVLACLRAFVFMCFRAWRACVLTCFRVYVLPCLACFRAWRAYVLACLSYLRAWGACVLAWVRACFDEMFYFLRTLRTWCALLSYLPYISILKFKNSYSKKFVCFVKLNVFLIYILIPTYKTIWNQFKGSRKVNRCIK